MRNTASPTRLLYPSRAEQQVRLRRLRGHRNTGRSLRRAGLRSSRRGFGQGCWLVGRSD